MIDEQVHEYIDSKTERSKNLINYEEMEELVEKKLKMNNQTKSLIVNVEFVCKLQLLFLAAKCQVKHRRT